MDAKQRSAAPSELCGSRISAAPAIIAPATVRTVHRRGKSMSRRLGQNGRVEVRNGAWRGRYLVAVPDQADRQNRPIVLALKNDKTKTKANPSVTQLQQKQ